MGSQSPTSPLTTTGVAVTVQVDSTTSAAPYYAASISGSATRSDGSTVGISGFGIEDLGVVDPNGADFTLQVHDIGNTQTQAQVLGWALAFLQRQPTGPPAPIGNGQLSNTGIISGNGGTFTLISPQGNGNGNGTKGLKNVGNTNRDWDWALMIQLQMGNGPVKVFVSDPEMQMDTETGN